MHQNRERTRNGYSWGSSAIAALHREVLFTASKEGQEETGGGEAALGQTLPNVSEAEKLYSRRGNVKFRGKILNHKSMGGRESLTISHWGHRIHQCPSCLQGTNFHVHERTLRDLRGWAPKKTRIFCSVRSKSWHELPWQFTCLWSFWRYGNN